MVWNTVEPNTYPIRILYEFLELIHLFKGTTEQMKHRGMCLT